MTLDTISLAPSFSVDFWQPYVSVTDMGHAVEAMDTTATPALSYSAELHGTHADFCRSAHFVQYQEQVRASVSFLVEFCRQHDMLDAHTIEENFNVFLSHRFEDAHYFDTRAEMVDAIGKRSLDEFCSMIRNEAIDEGKRTAAIRDLSYGMILCADGAVSNLVSAACMLAKSAGGIRGKLWELKEETAVHVLRQLIAQRYGDANNYRGNEIHYVNTVWNILADQFGLQKRTDSIRMAEAAEDGGFLVTCAAGVSAALTPDRLALLIAEACQARFNSTMAPDEASTSGVWNARTERDFSEALEDIGNDFGLTSADALAFDGAADTAKLRASELRMKSFLELAANDTHAVDASKASTVNDVPDATGVTGATEADGDARDAEANDDACTYTYTMRSDPSLIALDVLRAMDGLKLLQPQTGPCNSGEWVDESGMRAALFVYGELAWTVRIPRGGKFDDPVWNSLNVEFEPITVSDLLRWAASRGDDGPLPPAPAIRQAIQVTTPERLMEMPARWLEDAQDLQRLVQRLGTEKAADYLAKHLSVLGAIGAGFTNPEREEVLARILRMGLGNAVRRLAEQWLPNAITYADMIYAVLLREAMPALHRAMLAEDPKTAVQAWYQPLYKSGLLTLVAPRLAALLRTRYIKSSILSYALSNGHTGAVEAFYVLLKNLLKDSTIRWHIKDELPGLLIALDAYYMSALSNAMAEGHTGAVQAFYAGLKDLLTDPALALTIRPALLQALPALLTGKNNTSDCGLAYAVEHCNSAVIVAFHAMLNDLLSDPIIAPHIQGALPELLAAKFLWRASALSEAMRHRDTTAIEAFYAVLTDPGIIPHIRYAMPDLLNGMDSYGKTGLSNALAHGNTACIQAYHALLKKLLKMDTVAPHIQRMMPKLVTARDKDGTSGYWSAVENGHTGAVVAFLDILGDPDICPYTGESSALFPGEQPNRYPEDAVSTRTGPQISDLD